MFKNNLKSLSPLVFLCGARDFHAIDWYKSAKKILQFRPIYILTDLITGEGFKKLVSEEDIVIKLLIIDNILLNKQSRFGNIWRNIVKLIVFPIQVFLLKIFSRRYPGAFYHAHSMYYLFLAWAAKIPFTGTPQGSDILIKPFSSRLFRYFTIKALLAAQTITVDSIKMQKVVFELSGVHAQIIQNGIDLNAINSFMSAKQEVSWIREKVVSIRGITPLYRIKEVLESRNSSKELSNTQLTFIYPFSEREYLLTLHPIFKTFDQDMNRLARCELYKVLFSTKLVISIPISDSSPRSVYEAIFCGCAVAITYNAYYEILPICMKERIIIVDLKDNKWFSKAVNFADIVVAKPYTPSSEAIELFDQKKSFLKLSKYYQFN